MTKDSKRNRDAATRSAERQAGGPKPSTYAAKGSAWRPDTPAGGVRGAAHGETVMRSAFSKATKT